MHEGNEWMVFGLLIFTNIITYGIARTISWNKQQDELAAAYRAGYMNGQLETMRSTISRSGLL